MGVDNCSRSVCVTGDQRKVNLAIVIGVRLWLSRL